MLCSILTEKQLLCTKVIIIANYNTGFKSQKHYCYVQSQRQRTTDRQTDRQTDTDTRTHARRQAHTPVIIVPVTNYISLQPLHIPHIIILKLTLSVLPRGPQYLYPPKIFCSRILWERQAIWHQCMTSSSRIIGQGSYYYESEKGNSAVVITEIMDKYKLKLT